MAPLTRALSTDVDAASVGTFAQPSNASLLPGWLGKRVGRTCFHKRRLGTAMAVVLGTILSAAEVSAAPYKPDDAQRVLERVRPANDPVSRMLQTLKSEVQEHPEDIDAAVRLIRRYIGLAREQGDPRYAGYAEAVLQPWLDVPSEQPTALLLRATLRQYRHDFQGALDDLDQVLAHNEKDPQARVTRASLHQLRADYPAAEQDCQALNASTLDLVRQICLAGVVSLTGKAEIAYQTLETTLGRLGNDIPQGLDVWALQILGDIAVRRGMTEVAEGHYRMAIALGGGDLFLTCALFDLLLDQGRVSEARDLLGDDLRADLLLLRHALAAHATNDPSFQHFSKDLEARFAAAARRGEQLHLREEARFRLLLPEQAEKSLELAALNWKSQREPEDARVLLEAALAAGRSEAALPVIDWAKASGIEDVRIAALITEIEEDHP